MDEVVVARAKSLRGKFVRTMLLVIGLVGVANLALVAVLNTQASAHHLATVRLHIEEGIRSKGRVLAENQALAMRMLVLDNAYLDMQRLVGRAVKEDDDLIFGVYISSEKHSLAFCRRGEACEVDKVVSKDAWRALGLTESELNVASLQIRQVNRLGEELLEVSMPVLGEEHEAVGTIRYGLSTKRMHDALTAAHRDSMTRLQRSLLLLSAIVGFFSLLGVLLSRIQAVRITRPVLELDRAARKLAAGDRAVRVSIRSGDELEALGVSFNRMIEDLDASYRQLEELNRTLEQKVQARTAELVTMNRDMRLVLDNVDQGFVTLSMQGVMAAERSLVVDEWFGVNRAPITFWEFIAPISHSFALDFQIGWSQIVDDFLPLEVVLDQLPARIAYENKTYSLRFLPFFKEGVAEGILVVIADITERLLKEREEAEQAELMQGFKRLMLDRSGFLIFVREASEMLELIKTPNACDTVVLKRTLHTLKGNAAVMGLLVVARLCHLLEEQLSENGRMSNATIGELSARWVAIVEHIAIFTGGDRPRVIEIPQSEYAALVSRLSTETHGELLDQVLSWQLEPVTKAFERLAEQARALAHRLGRGEINVSIEGGGVRLDPDSWAPFFSALVHVVRNAIDHGIESVEERVRAGKPAVGSLRLKAETGSESLILEVGDDGRGIDWPSIAEKATVLGMSVKTQHDLEKALFCDGLSTKREVTDVSGRGIGMSVVYQRVRDMDGTIDVRSVRGAGTTWIIRFPWDSKAIPTVRARASTHPKSTSA
jgi:two-component system chemotaxis sensor kinase CheA